MEREILIFIGNIRDSFEGSIDVYTKGSCYHFHTILVDAFPKGIAYCNGVHVITRIGDHFYDITGRIMYSVEKFKPLYTEYPNFDKITKFNIYKDVKVI